MSCWVVDGFVGGWGYFGVVGGRGVCDGVVGGRGVYDEGVRGYVQGVGGDPKLLGECNMVQSRY